MDASDQTLTPYFDHYLNWLLHLYKPINEFKEILTVQKMRLSTSVELDLSMAYLSIEGKLKKLVVKNHILYSHKLHALIIFQWY